MARSYKRDKNGRFASTGSGASGSFRGSNSLSGGNPVRSSDRALGGTGSGRHATKGYSAVPAHLKAMQTVVKPGPALAAKVSAYKRRGSAVINVNMSGPTSKYRKPKKK